MAQIGWIDFSDEHRQRVFSVLDLLSEKGTIDELGIGVIRDAVADLLFPGVSTIQTRPKYFILLSQIFLDYMREYKEKKKCAAFEEYLLEKENGYMHELAEAYGYQEGNGVIGIKVARKGGELARKASSIYWGGLKIHGIIQTPLSLKEYLEKNDLSILYSDRYQSEEDSCDDDDPSWKDGFGVKAPNFKALKSGKLSLELNEEEATFLKDKFVDCNGGRKKEENLLRQILLSPKKMDIVCASRNFQDMAEALIDEASLPSASIELLNIALLFDLLIQGAHIQYNIQLQSVAGAQDYSHKWHKWLADLDAKKREVAQLDIDDLCATIARHTPHFTRQFLKNWKDQVLNDPTNQKALIDIIASQEKSNKGLKARLHGNAGKEVEKWVGLEKLDYRFGTVKSFVVDIKKGLIHA